MKRGEVSAHPKIVFQATLSGMGCLEQQGRRWAVAPENAFFTVIPSRHVYYLPVESAEWSFFWFTFSHPYVVERLSALAKRHAPVFSLPHDSKFAALCLSFFERTCAERFDDVFAPEGALFEWMLGFERHLYDLAHPRTQREAMLEDVRKFTLANLSRSFGIDDLAKRQGLSRSHFSHLFRKVTGLAPASFILEVRLGEVRQRLRQSSEPLKDLAGATGFSDANHLCKVFRRFYHMSPGMYRRLMK